MLRDMLLMTECETDSPPPSATLAESLITDRTRTRICLAISARALACAAARFSASVPDSSETPTPMRYSSGGYM